MENGHTIGLLDAEPASVENSPPLEIYNTFSGLYPEEYDDHPPHQFMEPNQSYSLIHRAGEKIDTTLASLRTKGGKLIEEHPFVTSAVTVAAAVGAQLLLDRLVNSSPRLQEEPI